MPEIRFPHLYLVDWPFQVVPDPRFSRIWADREDLYRTVTGILRKMARIPQASIHLIWAWYGAGKSHTLQHMAYLCMEKYQGLHPVYTVFPKAVSSFLDFYQSLMRPLDVDLLIDQYASLTRGTSPGQLQRALGMPADLLTILKYLHIGDERSRDIALQWLRAEKPHLATLRSMGINSRIQSTDDAVQVLRCIVRLMSFEHPGARLIWMIDEFQRIGDFKASLRSEINAGLHSAFNDCPTNFSLILSFSVRSQATMNAMLSPELLDRACMQPVITIPPLTPDQAKVFVGDLLQAFRSPEHIPPSRLFPFDEGAVNAIVEQLEADPNVELKPRSIMQACDLILGEADVEIEERRLQTISREYALQVLGRHNIDTQGDMS